MALHLSIRDRCPSRICTGDMSDGMLAMDTVHIADTTNQYSLHPSEMGDRARWWHAGDGRLTWSVVIERQCPLNVRPISIPVAIGCNKTCQNMILIYVTLIPFLVGLIGPTPKCSPFSLIPFRDLEWYMGQYNCCCRMNGGVTRTTIATNLVTNRELISYSPNNGPKWMNVWWSDRWMD